jgi:hypothetical protein
MARQRLQHPLRRPAEIVFLIGDLQATFVVPQYRGLNLLGGGRGTGIEPSPRTPEYSSTPE